MRWFLVALIVSWLGCPSLFATNFDFASGTLNHWDGQGFYVTTDSARGPGHGFGVCSSDSGSKNGLAALRFRFTVPSEAGLIRFTAFANRPKQVNDRGHLQIDLLDGNVEVPLLRKTADGWQSATAIGPRSKGNATEYAWDVSALRGRPLEVQLVDADDRPNCYLYSSGFRIYQGTASRSPIDAVRSKLNKASTTTKMPRFVRSNSPFFNTLSNADEQYTNTQVRNCEMLYRLFYSHFKKRGFPVRPLTQKMAMVVFHSPKDMDAFLGFQVPRSITGLYFRTGNYLMLYDIHHHEQLVAQKQLALANSSRIPLDIQRVQYIQNVKSQVAEWTDDVAVSAAMHETAHQVSFNCGLLNRHGDVPLWLGEGLACYCESTTRGRWEGIGRPNLNRIKALAEADEAGSLFPLRTLLTSDEWRQTTQEAITGYGQSWALFHMLMRRHPQQLQRYLQLIYNRRGNEHRLTDFCQVFGTDLNRFEREYLAYVQELVQQHGQSN